MYSLVFVLALSVAPGDTAGHGDPQWAISQDEPEPDAAFAAWLTLPVAPVPAASGSNAGRVATAAGAVRHRISVSFPNSQALAIWVRAVGSSCESGRGDSTWSGLVSQDTVIAVCAQATRREDVRLVAIVEDSARSGVATHVATSTVIRARQPWYDPGPTLSGVLTAAIGFITGLGTAFIQRWWDRKRAADDAEKAKAAAAIAHTAAMEEAVVRAIGREWSDNRQKLERFTGSTTLAPEMLVTAGYGAILGDAGGMLAYLGDPTRQPYLARIITLYTQVSEYNDAWDDWNTTPGPDLVKVAREAADKTLAAYNGLPVGTR